MRRLEDFAAAAAVVSFAFQQRSSNNNFVCVLWIKPRHYDGYLNFSVLYWELHYKSVRAVAFARER